MQLRARLIRGGHFRFLELPAELRNAIYKVICDRPQFKLAHRQHRRRLQGALNYLQLAHVNQQLRQEFLPIYYDRVPLIRYCDASRFIRDFALPLRSRKEISTLILDIDGSTEDDDSAADMLPLLKYLKTDTSTRLVLLWQEDTRKAILHQLFHQLTALPNTSARTKWDSYMQKHVKELRIAPSAPPHVEVVVKYAAMEYWMRRDCGMWAKDSWLEKTGFPFDGSVWLGDRNDWTVGVSGP